MNQYLKELDAIFEDLFLKKAPPLSKNAKEWVVKIAPWLALVFGLMVLSGLLTVSGFGIITAPLWIFSRHSTFYLISTIIGIAQAVLELIAVPHLFKRTKRGWELLYWSNLLGVLSGIIHISVFSLIFVAVSLYFLYQVREYYK